MTEYNLDKEVADVRSNDLSINPLILDRWSPRSLLNKPIPEEDLLGVIEAARWAPSCFNEQPWRFIVARKAEDLKKMQSCLNESNRVWANQAPVLIAVISSPRFSQDGKPNRWSAYDTGTAWGYLALEARRRGFYAHAMGGFSVEKVCETFGVPKDWEVHSILALGYRGPAEQLPPALQQWENPSERRPIHESWSDSKFAF